MKMIAVLVGSVMLLAVPVCWLIGLAASACGLPESPDVTDVVEIRRLARIKLPASATNVRCATMCGIDRLTYGRFDIPERDLGIVLADMPADRKVRPLEGYSNVTSHKMDEPWWRPDQLKRVRVADGSIPGFSFNLLFGESDTPGVLTVYFFNFTL